jgi:hypothetical protein
MDTGSDNASSANGRAMTPPLIWLDQEWITVVLKNEYRGLESSFRKGNRKCVFLADLLKGESAAYRYPNKFIERPTSGGGRKKMPPLKGETYLTGLNVMRLPAVLWFGESMPTLTCDAVWPGGVVT